MNGWTVDLGVGVWVGAGVGDGDGDAVVGGGVVGAGVGALVSFWKCGFMVCLGELANCANQLSTIGMVATSCLGGVANWDNHLSTIGMVAVSLCSPLLPNGFGVGVGAGFAAPTPPKMLEPRRETNGFGVGVVPNSFAVFIHPMPFHFWDLWPTRSAIGGAPVTMPQATARSHRPRQQPISAGAEGHACSATHCPHATG
jgi:hypothetical protein